MDIVILLLLLGAAAGEEVGGAAGELIDIMLINFAADDFIAMGARDD